MSRARLRPPGGQEGAVAPGEEGTPGAAPVPGLAAYLSLEALGADTFRGDCHAGAPGRAYGGLVAAQALVAAGGTVEASRLPHSMHGYFVRQGDPEQPVEYRVERVRSGRIYDNRTVVAHQHDRTVYTLSASFKVPENAEDSQAGESAGTTDGPHPGMPVIPGPEDLPDPLPVWAAERPRDFVMAHAHRRLDLRYHLPGEPGEGVPPTGVTRQYIWFKVPGKLPDDPLLHASALVYAADTALAPTAAMHRELPAPLRRHTPRIHLASLDYALWLHRPFRADEWLLLSVRGPLLADGRGLGTGECWTREGVLVASSVQEAVVRPRRRRSA
ncbi:acyl-CoA thioesterase [Streptomyces sp. NPDC051018]|uniref:acyl-CoA thioesterase n=1 Tax=Streptomyces sp. NPDC051018 TaxID=3365639 RepID=UPI0037AFFD42